MNYVYIGAAAAGDLAVVLGLFLLLCYSLARRNILFTFVQEGTVKAIMRGKTFDHLVMSYHGFHLNDPRKPWYKDSSPPWEVLQNDWKDFSEAGGDARALEERYDDRFWFERFLGAYWVGIPPFRKVLWYKFEWAELQLGKDGEEKIWSRHEPTDFIYVNDFTYLAVIRQLKTGDKESLEVWIEYNRTIGINNPYKALFRTAEWLNRVGAATDREAKDHVGKNSYEDLQSESKAASADQKDFSAPMCLLNDRLPDDPSGDTTPWYDRGLKGHYGVTLRAAELRKVQMSGDAEQKNNEAASAAFRAKKEAEATRLAGKAQADVIEMVGKAEANSLKSRLDVIQSAGEAGLAVAQFDSIVEASKNPAALIIEANDLGGAAAGVVAKAAANLATSPKPSKPVAQQTQPPAQGATP
ncbi:MAG TPA: hypothetical protein VHC68_03615 [Candidatus Paceibacterota bacterium]|nr:hypothetical protein [Candidatus Paceibacterota bacterium]